MIKHIVIWRLQDSAGGHDKAHNARLLKQRLEALNGKIPGLIRLEVGIDFSHDAHSGDVVLYSEFESRAALQGYHDHPEHQALIPLLLELRSERRVVDYQVEHPQTIVRDRP
ncbi:MAG: Dabb family protein [Gammaproteobacteria bacterium]|nr:Dabb family protein [Gammaproteobacteria bacterium]